MDILLNLGILFASVFVLARSSVFLVRSLLKIAAYLNLRDFSVAFILMALATSLPEIFVGISAALEDAPTLVLGNVLGSNIVDLTLVLGIVVLVSGGLHARSVIARRDAWYMFLFTAAPVFLLVDRVLSRGDAVILVIFYLVYVIRLLNQRSAFHDKSNHVPRSEAIKHGVLFLVGAVLLMIGAKALVISAKNLAEIIHIPIGLIGIFVVAFGTSLPELAFELRAVRRDEDALVLGDLIGSVVTNSTLVLAITAFVRPIIVENVYIYVTPFVVLTIALILFEMFVATNKRVSIGEGIILIFLYILFLVSEFGIGLLSVV